MTPLSANQKRILKRELGWAFGCSLAGSAIALILFADGRIAADKLIAFCVAWSTTIYFFCLVARAARSAGRRNSRH